MCQRVWSQPFWMVACSLFTGHEEDATDQCARKRVQRGRRWAQVQRTSLDTDLLLSAFQPAASPGPTCALQAPATRSPLKGCNCILCRYYDVKVGGGQTAKVGDRVAVHYEARWKGVTFMTSRQGMGVTGGSPIGFDVVCGVHAEPCLQRCHGTQYMHALARPRVTCLLPSWV